jgi:3-hydroxyacyl-CoA dehydrogenase
MAMGPLAVGDLAGLDIGYRARRNEGIEVGAIAEHALADRLVEAGRLGQKAGRGYYRYEDGRRVPDPDVDALRAEVAAAWSIPQRDIDDDEITGRLSHALINEGARILEEGIASRPSDIDIVYINGYGFPAWRGGPMFLADSLGLETVVARLRQYETATGDRFWEPAPLLERLAGEGATLAARN